MATSVHIPPSLLKALDKKAKKLRVSRNSLIVKAIERDLGLTGPKDEKGWPVGFFEALAAGASDRDAMAEFDESMRAVIALRRSKKPIDL